MRVFVIVLLLGAALHDVTARGLPRQVVYLDMTHVFDNTTQYWGEGTQKPPTFEDISEADNNTEWFYNNFCIGEHVGTHMDAPKHLRGGPDIDFVDMPTEQFTGPGIMIDVSDKNEADVNYALSLDDVIDFEAQYGIIPPGAIVFQCSGWDQYWNDTEKFWGGDPTVIGDWNFPGFSGEAANFLVQQRGINGIGSDAPSGDVGNSHDFPAHHETLHQLVWILENVKATCSLPPIGSTVYAFPLKIRHGSGFPTRVVASWQNEVVDTLIEKVKTHPGIPYAELLENAAYKPNASFLVVIFTVAISLIQMLL